MMAQRDPAAAAAQRYKPTQSAVPGTTLGPIQIDAFLGGGVYAILIFFFIKLYDTPAVHLHHRQAAVVHSEDLPALAPRSRHRSQCFPVLPQTRLTFYGPKASNILWCPLTKQMDFTRPACDLAISGLGWIAVEPMGRSLRTSGSDLEETAK